MWRRTSDDPLARLLLDRYGLHLLRHPREDVSIGDVYPQQDSHVLSPGRLDNFIVPAPELPPIRRGEKMTDVAGTTSNIVSREAGFGFLESFLAALGALGLSATLRARLEAGHAGGLRFRFANATRDYVDPFALERRLRKQELALEDTLMKPGYRYYLVLGVVRGNAISFTAVDEQTRALGLDVAAVQLAEAGAAIKLERAKTEEVTVTGGTSLAFGVELSELLYNEQRRRLELAVTHDLIQVRADEEEEIPGRAWSRLGGAEADMFLPVPEPPPAAAPAF